MLALIVQTVKKSKWSIVGYALTGALMVWLFVSIWPTIAQRGQELEKLFESYPQELFKAFGIEGQSFLANLEGYLGGEQYSITWQIMLLMLVVSFGGGALAGEIERGTIGILLSQPISRIKLFLGKYLAGVILILIFVWVSILSVVPFAEIYNAEYRLSNNVTMAILGSLFALALFSLTMMLSALFSERSKVTLFSAGLFISMYVINIIAALKENLGDLKYLSLLHYFKYNDALIKNKIDPLSVMVFLGVAVVCTAVGIYWFNRRDIAAS